VQLRPVGHEVVVAQTPIASERANRLEGRFAPGRQEARYRCSETQGRVEHIWGTPKPIRQRLGSSPNAVAEVFGNGPRPHKGFTDACPIHAHRLALMLQRRQAALAGPRLHELVGESTQQCELTDIGQQPRRHRLFIAAGSNTCREAARRRPRHGAGADDARQLFGLRSRGPEVAQDGKPDPNHLETA
jgi:hypothetical protein